MPWASGISGAGPSSVSLSMFGAYSWSLLSISSNVTVRPTCAAMRPIEVTRLALTPFFASLNGLIAADGVDQVVPLVLVGILIAAFDLRLPDHLGRFGELALVGAGLRAAIAALGEDRVALGALCATVVIALGARHRAAVHDQLGAVGEGVFHGVGVEVLVDAIAAIVAAAQRPWR